MDTKDFIAEIFNRPPIWMSKHPHHRLKNVTQRLWNEMKQRFPEYEVEQLKKKWKNLKDTYRKELKKFTTRPGDPYFVDDTPSQWIYFNNMSFLKEELFTPENKSNLKSKHQNTECVQETEDLPNLKSEHRTKETQHESKELSNVKIEYQNSEFEHETTDLSNVKIEYQNIEFEHETADLSNLQSENQDTVTKSETEELPNLKSEHQDTESEHETENLNNVLSPSEEHTMSSPSPLGSPRPLNASPEPCSSSNTLNISRKRLTPNDIRAEYLEIEKKKLKILEQDFARQNNTVKQNSPEKTDDYYYLMSLLPEMQKFSSIQKMRVRNKINQVLMDEMILNNK